MYVRTTSRTAKDGTVVRYLQLAHNEWDAAAGRSRPRILFSFGRADQLDRAAIERLIGALTRLLDPAAASALTGQGELAMLDSRPIGGTHLLDGVWHRLGIDARIRDLLSGRKLDGARVERVLFALVASRALAASSKLAAVEWIGNDVHIDGIDQVSPPGPWRERLAGVKTWPRRLPTDPGNSLGFLSP
jgi:hypothetical protein